MNNPRSSILLGISPWTNAEPFFPSSKLSTYLSSIRYIREHELVLQELGRFGIESLGRNRLGVTKIVLLGFESVPIASRFVSTRGRILNKSLLRIFHAVLSVVGTAADLA
ncbi:hypothetical protein Tco_1471975 [Tanacetum coccineum]